LHAPEFLNRLTRLAEDAGGEAPLPKCPDTSHLTDIAIHRNVIHPRFGNFILLGTVVIDTEAKVSAQGERVPDQILVASFPKINLYGFGRRRGPFPEFLRILEEAGAAEVRSPRCQISPAISAKRWSDGAG